LQFSQWFPFNKYRDGYLLQLSATAFSTIFLTGHGIPFLRVVSGILAVLWRFFFFWLLFGAQFSISTIFQLLFGAIPVRLSAKPICFSALVGFRSDLVLSPFFHRIGFSVVL
jgi:hypothetical protein